MIGFAVWFAYDGYFNEKFKAENTDSKGQPNSTLVFNQRAPFFLAAGTVIAAIWFAAVKGRKITADEDAIVLNSSKKIAYDSIESIDKTNFEAKGFFVISYKGSDEQLSTCKLSDRSFDNLSAVLDKLVEKIS